MYGQSLFLYAYHRTGRDRAVAEDIRQETLLAAIQAIESYRGEVPLFGWLCGIARHKIADLLGSQRRESLISPDFEKFEKGEEKLLAHWLFSKSELLPEEIVDRSETQAAVVEALWSLPADYREALISRYVREQSVEELAVKLGRSYKATESLLSRAREALRQKLKETIRDDR